MAESYRLNAEGQPVVVREVEDVVDVTALEAEVTDLENEHAQRLETSKTAALEVQEVEARLEVKRNALLAVRSLAPVVNTTEEAQPVAIDGVVAEAIQY
jgi:hypothetical protein